MSDLSQYVGVGPKTIQSAYVDGANSAKSTGTGEDDVYWDFTLGTTLTDYTKAQVFFTGGISRGNDFDYDSMRFDSTNGTQMVSARLTSNSNLRVSSPCDLTTSNHVTGRYTVVEWW